MKLSSIRPESPSGPSTPNPPANCVAVNPRGNSKRASGFPRVSAMIRSRTRSSSFSSHRQSQQRLRIAVYQATHLQLPKVRKLRTHLPYC